MHPKDPVPANRKKGVVYSIPCAQCPCTYIRQLGRSLDLAASALAKHTFSCDNQVDLSKATVIDAPPHTQTHCMLCRVLAYPTPTGPAQQRQGHSAKSLCCIARLGLTMQPSGAIIILCYYYYQLLLYYVHCIE